MTAPEMEKYLKRQKTELSNFFSRLKDEQAKIVDRAEEAELKAKYYKNQCKIIMERHRAAFEYMNELYVRVLGKLREKQGK